MSHVLKRALALGALVAVSLPAMAFASEGPYATFNIKVEDTAAVSEVSPVVTSPITKDHVQFHIINNTGKALYFANGQEQSYIPVVSNNTVTAPYAPGQQYKVVDGDGHTVAQWNLEGGKVATANVNSASQAQFAQWGSTLQQVLENQRVSYVEPPAKAEPHYYTTGSHSRTVSYHHHSSHKVIRGYW
jgi:hypothetical protein